MANCSINFKKEENIELKISARKGILERIVSKLSFKGNVEFIEDSNENIIKNILNMKIDLGITYEKPNSNEIVSKKLFDEKFVLIVPKEWKISLQSVNNKFLNKIINKKYIAYKFKDPVLADVLKIYDVSSENIKYFRIINDYNQIVNLVESGIGWAIVPEFLLKENKKY